MLNNNDILISGEKLQELVDLTIVFTNQNHIGLLDGQLPNTNTTSVFIDNTPTPTQLEEIRKAKSLFVYTHALDLFFSTIYPHLDREFVLMSHNSDYGVEERHRRFLDEGKIIKWFTQNRLISHPKLFSIPIGIANSQWDHGDQKLFNSIRNQHNKKETLVYKNFDASTNSGQRVVCDRVTSQNGIPHSSRTNMLEYWTSLSKSIFVVSPPGNGIDCHRIWEALYLNTVPVVLKHESFSQFNHLPILFIDSWEQVTIDFLRSKVEKYQNSNMFDNIKELNIDHWRECCFCNK